MPPFFRCCLGALLVALAGSAATNAGAADEVASTWLDSYTTRLEALALLETLNADLLSHDSATARSGSIDRLFSDTTIASASGSASEGCGTPITCRVRRPPRTSVLARSDAPV